MTMGHCACGAITFAFDGEPKWILSCHCQNCRRATSAPMSTWLSVPLSAFRFTSGTPTYYASSPGVRRGFCAECGSPLCYEHRALPDEIHILAGALDDPGTVRPTAHVFTVDQLPWFDVADDLPRYLHTRRNAQPIHFGPRRRTPG